MRPRIGELFSGYGGLGMGVQAVYGGSIAWHSDIDKGACKILAHRYPDVPNIGDVTAVDWSQVEPVDILTGGSPCQDLSHAGRRAGMTEGTRSNLWVAMREAIAQLRPPLVVWENVRGAASAEATSALEFCPGCMGDGRPRTVLRALGRVVGDLSDLGYDCRWHGLRAADVGAPHGRFRVFVVATDARAGERLGRPGVVRGGRAATERSEASDHAGNGGDSLPPTPSCSDTNGAGQHGDGGLDLRTAVALLPPPTVQDGSNTGGASQFDRNSIPLNALVTLLPTPADMQAKHGNGNGHGKSLAIEAQRLLPTPRATNNENRCSDDFDPRKDKNYYALLNGMAQWGDYAAAIARWETTLGRPAPAPTMTSTKGNPQLSPAFVEWLMGLPAGWVTDVPGITRNEALKALGNGVVPAQCAAALRIMAGWESVA